MMRPLWQWEKQPARVGVCTCRRSKMRLVLLGLFFSVSVTTVLATDSGHIDQQDRSSNTRRIVRRLHAPPIVNPRANELVLRCDYDLHGEELYSVNWYRNQQMLFKYQPSLSPPGIDFETNPNSNEEQQFRDVRVSLDKSNATHFLLERNQEILSEDPRRYEGTYTCEVLIERTFVADYATANVSAAILPNNNPVIEGLLPTYQESEQLDVTCKSAPSWPPAELTLLLNGQKVDRRFIQKQRNKSVGEVASSSLLSVLMPLERYDFPGGKLRITCRAFLPGLPTKVNYETEYTAKFEEVDNQRFAQELPSLLSAGFKLTSSIFSTFCSISIILRIL